MDEQQKKALENLRRRPKTSKEDFAFLRPYWSKAIEMLKSYGERYRSHVQDLPQPWRAIYTTFRLDAEVRNGGFHQYFWNGEGLMNAATEEDLGRVGATGIQEIFQRAVACFVDFDVAGEKRRSENTWEEFTAGYTTIPWEKLDTEFYEASPTLFAQVAKYVREHPGEFNLG